jgi:outer membrane receptor protein involved in Fe transport
VHQLHGGWSVRYDDIANVGLAGSENAEIYELRTQASVEELAHGVYGSVHSQWTDWFASIVGVRYDNYTAKVDDKLRAAEEKEDTAELVSPKLSLRVGPFAETEFFANYGEGFHSNDARGAVNETSDVPFLAESKGYEIGLRTAIIPDLQLSLVAFHLDLDSELVFIGDEGTTEAVGASIREGVELGIYYQPTDWFIVDVDYANSTTRFKDEQFDGAIALGRYVPDSVDEVFSMGASVDFESGLYAGLRLRYFGPRKLTESGDIKSDATGLVNANIGYRWQRGALAGWNIGVEVLNLLDAEDDDITYYYASRTLDERIAATAPVEDRHSHPVESRTVRVTITKDF